MYQKDQSWGIGKGQIGNGSYDPVPKPYFSENLPKPHCYRLGPNWEPRTR